MSQATLNGILLDDGGEACQCRFRYGISSTLITYSTTPYIAGITTSTVISATVLGLIPGTRYYFQAEAVNSAGTSLGSILSFITPMIIPTPIVIPIVITVSALNILRYSAILNGTLVNDGGVKCSVGFEWGIDALNLSSSIIVGSGISPLPFSAVICSLTPGTKYYFRAFATNNIGTGYGAIESFITEEIFLPIPGLPGTPEGPLIPPPETLPPLIPGLPVPPVQTVRTILNFINIGLLIGGATGLILIISREEKKKKEKREEAMKGL